MALDVATTAPGPTATTTTRLARIRAAIDPVVLVLVAVLVVAAAVRLHELAARSLWVDELFSGGLAAQDLGTIVTVLYGEEANMALYYLVMSIWIRLVGADATEAWIRLPSVLFGLASIWALYRVGAELDRRLTGVIAALLASVNAYHTGISQEARAYTLWAFLVTLSWLWLLRAVDGRGRHAWIGYSVAVALSFYAHLFTLFVVLAQAIFVAIRARRTEYRAFLVSGIAVVGLCLPFVPFFISNYDGSQILHVRESDFLDLIALYRLFAGGSTWALWAYAGLGLIGLGVAVWSYRDSRDWIGFTRRLAPLLWLAVPILTLFLLSYVKPMFKDRYLFAAMLAFPLVAALGIATIRPRIGSIAAAAIVVGISLGPLFSDFQVRQDENWRSAALYLESNAQPDDGWIFISKRGQLGYDYYSGRLAGRGPQPGGPDLLEGFDWYDLATSETYYRALSSGTSRLPEFSARHPRIWLVLSHEFDSTVGGDTSTAVRDWLTRRGYAARQRTFQGVRVLLYERPT